MLPLVSILMPVYNTDKNFFIDAINSLIIQTYNNIEIIVVDDCSNIINVEEILKKINDSRICLIKNKINLGIPKTRNILLDKSRGKYIAFLDSDDIALPNRIKVEVEFLEKNYDIGVVGSNYMQIPKNRVIKTLIDKDKLRNYTLFRGSCFCNSTTMIRRDIIKSNNIKFNESYALAEDYGFWADLNKHTNFANINQTLVYLRVHESSITKSKKDIMKYNTAKILANQWLELIDNNERINEIILINFILGKILSANEIIMLENFLKKLLTKLQSKFKFYKQSRNYIARYLKKYILKVNDSNSLKNFLTSEIPDILKVKLITIILIRLKLAILCLRK